MSATRIVPILFVLALIAGGIAGCFPDSSDDTPVIDPKPEPIACGGWLGDTCEGNTFCYFDHAATCGWADASGTCQTKPASCTDLWAPVCGCDGVTYTNSCDAAIHGVAELHDGACECTPEAVFAEADEVTGVWTGWGSWEVVWTFEADGTFTKQDLVSPCPPGVACVWSGIVTNGGTWTVAGYEVELSYETPDTSFSVSLPDALTMQATCDDVQPTALVQTLGGQTVHFYPAP